MRQICSWRLGPCITCPFSKCSQRCQEIWGFPRGLFTEVALLEKETERAWGKALAAEGRYPADVAFVCRCSIWSVRWQLIFFSLSVNMSWQPHALSRVFWAVRVPAGPQPPGIFLSGRGGRVTFWPWLFPALSPVSKLVSQLWAEAQTAEHTSAAVTTCKSGQVWKAQLCECKHYLLTFHFT